MQAAGVNIAYYPVRRDFEIDLEALASMCKGKARVLYITHFLGWPQPMGPIRELCRDRALLLVEDCALSFLSGTPDAPLGSFGEYSVFCLYKTLPIPNGGVLVANTLEGPDFSSLKLRKPGRLSVIARNAELTLQRLRSSQERVGAALFALKRGAGAMLTAARIARTPVGDTGFDVTSTDLSMSPISRSLMNKLNFNEIRDKRRHNFRFLLEALNGRGHPVRADLNEGVCPLFFPLLVGNKHRAAQGLWARGIEAIEFWNQGDPHAYRSGSDAEFLRRHVLEIPIHQELTHAQMAYIARQIGELERTDLDFGDRPGAPEAAAPGH
jgi:dTDP-4-amino-4,6-dideoxygalactose transaminase